MEPCERCENLRWKGMFVDATMSQPEEDSILWCFQTQLGLGPDGQLVELSACTPERGCYRAL